MKNLKLRLTLNYHVTDEGMWLRTFQNETGKYTISAGGHRSKQIYLRRGDMFRTDGCYLYVSPRDWLTDDDMPGPLIRYTGRKVR